MLQGLAGKGWLWAATARPPPKRRQLCHVGFLFLFMFGGGGVLFGIVKGLAPKVLMKQAMLRHKLKCGTYLKLVCN